MIKNIVIQSSNEGIVAADAFVEALCDELHLQNLQGTITLAVAQAVKNAIFHGNKGDASKTVSIACDYCRGGIYFQVSDHGDGFDYERYGLLTSDDEGTGIFIIKTLVDKMEYSDGGRTLRLEFLLDGIDSSMAMSRRKSLQYFYNKTSVEAK
ncbi:MAG: ATP-binding protein [Bacteroidales bacterium]|nr:ATP-binding protein [Candidatus Colimorpha onthohippi]